MYDDDFVAEAAEPRPGQHGGADAAPMQLGAGGLEGQATPSLSTAFETVLSCPLTDHQRSALAQMHTLELATPRIRCVSSCVATIVSQADSGELVAMMWCEAIVLRLLCAWVTARQAELGKVQAEQDTIGEQISEHVKLEREAMTARLIPRVRELMAERTELSRRRDATNQAAEDAAIAAAFGAVLAQDLEAEAQALDADLLREQLLDLKTELALQTSPASEDDEEI